MEDFNLSAFKLKELEGLLGEAERESDMIRAEIKRITPEKCEVSND